MLAQEAIEYVQMKVNKLDKRMNPGFIKHKTSLDKELKAVIEGIIDEISEEKEALKIVLESARVLHKEIEDCRNIGGIRFYSNPYDVEENILRFESDSVEIEKERAHTIGIEVE